MEVGRKLETTGRSLSIWRTLYATVGAEYICTIYSFDGERLLSSKRYLYTVHEMAPPSIGSFSRPMLTTLLYRSGVRKQLTELVSCHQVTSHQCILYVSVPIQVRMTGPCRASIPQQKTNPEDTRVDGHPAQGTGLVLLRSFAA